MTEYDAADNPETYEEGVAQNDEGTANEEEQRMKEDDAGLDVEREEGQADEDLWEEAMMDTDLDSTPAADLYREDGKNSEYGYEDLEEGSAEEEAETLKLEDAGHLEDGLQLRKLEQWAKKHNRLDEFYRFKEAGENDAKTNQNGTVAWFEIGVKKDNFGDTQVKIWTDGNYDDKGGREIDPRLYQLKGIVDKPHSLERTLNNVIGKNKETNETIRSGDRFAKSFQALGRGINGEQPDIVDLGVRTSENKQSRYLFNTNTRTAVKYNNDEERQSYLDTYQASRRMTQEKINKTT